MSKEKSKKIYAHLIAIGNELLIGQVIDTNSSFIAKELNKIGVEVIKISAISDNENEITKTIQKASKKAHIIITTGGLGPTKDDITKHTLAKLFGVDLVKNESVYLHIEKLFADYNLTMNAYTRTQANLPVNTIALHNGRGTAPGMWTKYNKGIIINLPGVPKEMKGLIEDQVIPKIKETFKTPHILHRTLLSLGVPESVLAENLHDWEINLPKQIKLAYLPNGTTVRLRISGYDSDAKKIEKLVSEKELELIHLLGNTYEPYNELPLEKQLFDLLKHKNLTISVAESCTGGAISAKIVSQPGVSDFFMGGIVAYSNEIKKKLLNVSAKTLEEHGAVSEQTVTEMATNMSQLYNTTIAIATSGIAPSPKISNKEEGKVYFGIYYKGKVKVYFYQLINLTRQGFIDSVVEKALKNTIEIIKKD
jgi:nicotinamide-nucleotide amidase